MTQYYFAPLEGITGYIYRRAHHAFYSGINRYYIPFIVPKEKKYLSCKEKNDVLPENNEGMTVIPQIMTNKPEDFLKIAKLLNEEYGYKEINLNLGCPSKTVVSKKRGAGFLDETDQLESFLDKVCNGLELNGMKLSIKTRIGKKSSEEFPRLLEIFSLFPLSELIVHPRLQLDFYSNTPNYTAFSYAYKQYDGISWKLCYNGDIFSVSDWQKLRWKYPKLRFMMIGRGLLINPMLVEEIKIREYCGSEKYDNKTAIFQRFASEEIEKAERKRRYEMHKKLLDDYLTVMHGEKQVLFKMKELWFYMIQDFTESQKYWKKMKKVQNLSDFEGVVNGLCREQRLRSEF